MTLEEQIQHHKEISQKIEELEQQRKELGIAILQQMKEKILQIGMFTGRRCNRLSIKLTLEEARFLNAVKMEEAIDKEKIKLLCQDGQKINGVTEIEYIQITKMK